MNEKLVYITLFISQAFVSCDRDSRGIITNELNDTILIQMIANDVKVKGFNPGGDLFLFQYYQKFEDTTMINPKTSWEDPVFIGEFYLPPKSSYLFGRSMGLFGVPSIHFDTLRIQTKNDLKEYTSKQEIFNEFTEREGLFFYMKIK